MRNQIKKETVFEALAETFYSPTLVQNMFPSDARRKDKNFGRALAPKPRDDRARNRMKDRSSS